MAASAGWAHSAALTNDGRLLTWGSYGERLGLGVDQASWARRARCQASRPKREWRLLRLASTIRSVSRPTAISTAGVRPHWVTPRTRTGRGRGAESGLGRGRARSPVDALAARRVVSIDQKDGLAIASDVCGEAFPFLCRLESAAARLPLSESDTRAGSFLGCSGPGRELQQWTCRSCCVRRQALHMG